MPTNFTGANSTPPVWIESKHKINSNNDVFKKDMKVEIKSSTDNKELDDATELNLGKIEDNNLKTIK